MILIIRHFPDLMFPDTDVYTSDSGVTGDTADTSDGQVTISTLPRTLHEVASETVDDSSRLCPILGPIALRRKEMKSPRSWSRKVFLSGVTKNSFLFLFCNSSAQLANASARRFRA